MKTKITFPMVRSLCIVIMLSLPLLLFSQGVNNTPATSSTIDYSIYLFVFVLAVLLLLVFVLSESAIALAKEFIKSRKKTLIIILSLLAAAPVYSQEPQKVSAQFPQWALDPLFYIVTIVLLIVLVAVLVIYRTNTILSQLIFPHESVGQSVNVRTKKIGVFRKIYLRMVDSVPVTEEKDILLDHDYDGIKELDNSLPPWWKYGFYLTIVFGLIYLMSYHVFDTGKLQTDEYRDELVLAEKQKEERIKKNADYVTEENVILLNDPSLLASGKETYQKLCAACHRNDGGGQVGPNLTDEYWIHGGGIKNIFKTITYGVPDKGMISWKSQLSPRQIQQVSSYILTMQGTNPGGAKEAQGEKWVDAIADSALSGAADTSKKIITLGSRGTTE